jgi:hypothetical protein
MTDNKTSKINKDNEPIEPIEYCQHSQKCMRCYGWLTIYDTIVIDPLYKGCVSHELCVNPSPIKSIKNEKEQKKIDKKSIVAGSIAFNNIKS